MGNYLNNDGLYVKIGTTKATPNKAGEYVTTGLLREVEVTIDLTTLTQSEVIQSDQVFIPAGVRIHEVEVIAKTGAATGTAIDLGLTRTDRTTEIDFNGLLAAFITASMNTAGETSIIRQAVTVPTGLAGLGALIGTTTTNVGYISCSATDATAFTAGVIIVKIRFYTP